METDKDTKFTAAAPRDGQLGSQSGGPGITKGKYSGAIAVVPAAASCCQLVFGLCQLVQLLRAVLPAGAISQPAKESSPERLSTRPQATRSATVIIFGR